MINKEEHERITHIMDDRKKVQKWYSEETGKDWMVVVIGNEGYATWDYQRWLEDKLAATTSTEPKEGIKESDGWIRVEDRLPEILETVWVSNGKGWTTLGCRSDMYQDDGEMLWCWCQTNGVIYEENGKIVSECETDDLDVLLWQPLPQPPIK